MPIYQLSCRCGHGFEVIQPMSAPLPACPECGGQTAKVPSVFGFAGQAARSLPPPPETMPQTWRGTYEGNREYLMQLRRTAEQRKVLEEHHPELAGDRRPILAHEGRFEHAPLRAGDPVPEADGAGQPGGPPAAGSARPADAARSVGAASPGGTHDHGGHHHPSRSAGGHRHGEARQGREDRAGPSRLGV
jgi:putative FmdB family regulatory protein